MILTLIIFFATINNDSLLAQTGQNIEGPSTYGQQTYPNSGSTRNRRNIMGGQATSASKASNTNGSLNKSKNGQERQEAKGDAPLKLGPYEDGQFQYVKP